MEESQHRYPSTFARPVDLSRRARVLWAKTGGGEERGLWSPLYVHMGDSACVARKIWDEWLSDSVKQDISGIVSGCNEAAKALVSWLAGVHDIGKAAPGFQYKVLERAERDQEMGLDLPPTHMMNHPPSHAYMSEIILERWLENRGWDYGTAYGSVVGAHHGAPPSNERVLENIEDASSYAPVENLGDDDWASLQDELLGWIAQTTGLLRYEELFKSLAVPQPIQVLLSAIVIMSDWIASNADFFPLVDCVETYVEFLARADAGWSSLALPSAWHPEHVALEGQELFHRRFADLPENATLRPAQVEALHAALEMSEPGLLIIEAPMGNGKTEASLLCAEVLAVKTGAGGVAYLLPTMATSNAMFTRVESWLEHVPDARGKSKQSMQLLHSKAALNSDYAKLRHWGSTWMGDNASSCTEEDVVAHQWFGGRKRGLLSSFVVGTVDQLLMAALKMRHVQLRHLGLAGKVVVIDEVHAYDAYMNTYLDRVLTWLGTYGVPTILLSATLPSERRNDLIHAYRGRDRKSSSGHSRRKDIPEAPRDEAGFPSYPLVTIAARSGALGEQMYRTCADPSEGTNVVVSEMEDDDTALFGLLDDALSDGGCACVLRDTVARAQDTYEKLQNRFGDSCVKLVHSRFIAVDRMANDAELLRLLGPDQSKRPHRLIVVGTQVIEQSLDIDFDVMVTDVAPIDLLLQRMGRLHRHQRGRGQSLRPEKLREARCYIVGVEDWTAPPPAIVEGISRIYPRALLWKSIAALRMEKSKTGAAMVNLPHDIARLVEAVYSPCEGEAGFEPVIGGNDAGSVLLKASDELNRRQADAQRRAGAFLLSKPQKRPGGSLIGWLRDSYSLTDEIRARAAVRDTDESIEVVVVQEREGMLTILPWVGRSEDGREREVSLGDGTEVPDDEAARLAATCTVSLPPALTSSFNFEQTVNALESQACVQGWQGSRWLRGQLPLVLDSSFNAEIESMGYVYRLRYSREAGLEITEKVKKGEDIR